MQALATHSMESLPAGLYSVHSVFHEAINLFLAEDPVRLFSIVGAQKPLVPVGLQLPVDQVPTLEVGSWVQVTSDVLILGDWTVNWSAAPARDLTWRGRITPNLQRTLLQTAQWLLTNRSPGLPSLHHFTGEATLTATVEQLVGWGPGLTPSGDDFLCGWLWAWLGIEHPRCDELKAAIAQRVAATTDVSQNFLTLACEAQFVEPLATFTTHPTQSLFTLAAQGASSGIDTLCGIVWGLTQTHF